MLPHTNTAHLLRLRLHETGYPTDDLMRVNHTQNITINIPTDQTRKHQVTVSSRLSFIVDYSV